MSRQSWGKQIAELRLAPVWRTTLEGIVAALRDEGASGERLIGWTVREFRRGRAQAAILDEEDLAPNHSAKIDWPVEAARLLQGLRDRHEALPDFAGWSWDELGDWVVEETDRRRVAGWRVREPVYSFSDGWTVELVRDEGDQEREGLLMRNCCGTPDIEPWRDVVLSLRDPDGFPHGDLVFRDGSLWEAAGRTNVILKPDYQERLREFLDWVEASSGSRLFWHSKANVRAMRSLYGEEFAPPVCVWGGSGLGSTSEKELTD